MNTQKKVALVRGDSLSEWEGSLWHSLTDTFAVTGVCSQKNLYSTSNLRFPVIKLSTTTDNIFIHNFYKYYFGIFQKMGGLEKLLANYDIAHTAEVYYFYTNQAVRAKALNKKLKVVATVWDNSFGRFEYNYWPKLKMSPAYWRKKVNGIIKENIAGVDMFLPVTAYSAGLLSDLGVPESKMQVITPAIVRPEEKNQENIIKELGLEGKEVYLVVNRMVKEKGVYDILYAWRMYLKKSKKTNAVLVLIGKGPEQKNLVRVSSEMGLGASVKFIEYLPNDKVRSLYKFVKVLILASLSTFTWQEQFGFVLAESISAGTPVISTFSGAIPEVVGKAGLLVPPAHPVALAGAFMTLDDQASYASLKLACQTEMQRFNSQNYIEKITSLYKTLTDV